MSSRKSSCLAVLMLIAIFFSSVSSTLAFRDEGMFPTDWVGKLNLPAKGLKIKPTDIYNPKGGGLSEAVIRMDTGCTAEFVSPEGLILTNHHCAFDALVSASTVAKNYGEEGYRALSRADELPAKDYAISIPKRVEDVTARVLNGITNLTGEARENAVKAAISKIEAEEKAKIPEGNTVRIQAVSNGYYYYLYENQQIKDIRIVYAPPKSIGYFGGDPDNFEWTRHTGDFTFLRAYVAPDGKSADYSANNVPFKPRKFLTISLNGLKENDFVFVMGNPGGTTRYRESQNIAYQEKVNFPFLYDFLTAWIGGLEQVAETDEEKRVALQSQIFSLANSQKLYGGGSIAMRRGGIIAKRQAEELKFSTWVNANPARQAKYGTLLADISKASQAYYVTDRRDALLRRFLNNGFTPTMKQVFDAINAVAQSKSLTAEKRKEIEDVYPKREPLLEREMIKFFLRAASNLPNNQRFQPIENLFNRFKGKERRSAEESFAELVVDNKDFDTPQEIVNLYSMSLNDLRKKYPTVVDFALALNQEQTAIGARQTAFNRDITPLRLLYMQGLNEMRGVTPYPDANFTQRFTYGYVKGYSPREAVIYQPFTTLKGVIEKDSGVEPFNVPQGLKDLQNRRDFGRYSVGDSVPVNFLATTDIIGGNSGSPIMNAFGEQVGIVFDGNYEGLGNDMFYNDTYGRTIAVDIRYVLFVTEKLGNAGWIFNEMNIKGGRAMTARPKR